MKTSCRGKVTYLACVCYLAIASFVMLSTCYYILAACPAPEPEELGCCWCDFCIEGYLPDLSSQDAGAGRKELVLLS